MMKFALLLSFLVTFNGYAQYCKTYKDKPLKIGCTYNCNRWITSGLVKAARHYKTFIKVINLPKNPEVKLTDLDAILIPGGADINPDYYVDKVPSKWSDLIDKYRHLTNISSESNERDPFEYEVATNYFKDSELKNTPMLGICRGMQMLTVSQAIPLYQDIKAELGIPNRIYKLDNVYITDFNSTLYAARGKKKFKGVELHHQGMRMDYWLQNKAKHPNMRVTAVSNKKKIIEGIEFTNRPALGVQFHPELTFGKTKRSIFRWLINQACTKRALK